MMGERVPIETKQRFVGLSLKLVTLSLDVLCLHVHFAIMELEDRDIAIPIDGYILGIWRHEWIYHDPVKAATDLPWDFSEDNEILDFSFQAAWEV
jgi:hypothetical protein